MPFLPVELETTRRIKRLAEQLAADRRQAQVRQFGGPLPFEITNAGMAPFVPPVSNEDLESQPFGPSQGRTDRIRSFDDLGLSLTPRGLSSPGFSPAVRQTLPAGEGPRVPPPVDFEQPFTRDQIPPAVGGPEPLSRSTMCSST